MGMSTMDEDLIIKLAVGVDIGCVQRGKDRNLPEQALTPNIADLPDCQHRSLVSVSSRDADGLPAD